MTIEELVRRNRSVRRFQPEGEITPATLRELIDLARLSPSASNRQPLKFLPVCDRAGCEGVFPHLSWAGYLEEWSGPAPGERPTAYIIILGDREICDSFGCDHGIAAQSIMLGAVARGLAGCMIGSIRRQQLREILDIPSHLEILLVLALGLPAETVRLEPLPPDGDIRYWRDEQGVHHVPKRPLEELIINRSRAAD